MKKISIWLKSLAWIGEFIATVVAIVFALLIVGYFIGLIKLPEKGDESLKGDTGYKHIITGSAAVDADSAPTLIKFPSEFVDGDATTTPTYAVSDNFHNIGNASTTGGLINQLVFVEGFTDYTLYGDLRAGTATSTFCYRTLWSYDGVSFYDLDLNLTASSTSSDYGTSTPNLAPALSAQAVCVDPGIATSTLMIIGSIPDAKYARFEVWGEEVSTDPNDGVEGHIEIMLSDNTGKQ